MQQSLSEITQAFYFELTRYFMASAYSD